MKGLIMDEALTLDRLLERAATLFGEREVRTLRPDGRVDRRGWSAIRHRALALAAALEARGVEPGQRVASLAWNTHRHLEVYFGVPGAGAVLLTVNVRLLGSRAAEILRSGGARVLFLDGALVDELPTLARQAPELELVVVLDREGTGDAGPEGAPRPLPEAVTTGSGPVEVMGYESLLAETEPRADFRPVEERAAAAMCYTSGTTGRPKGVVYSHRALVLHTLAISLPDAFRLGEDDVILPAVPMFHANAWGLPFAAAMAGADLVLPGRRPRAPELARLLEQEAVTFAAGVPTVWMDVLEELRRSPRDLGRLRAVHVGGAPTPPRLLRAYRDELEVMLLPGWGMTELSPVGLVNRPRLGGGPRAEEDALRQGRPLPLLEIRIVNGEGEPLPWDGETPGELEVRGPWVASGYHDAPAGTDAFRDGWLRTGDVATVDHHGYVRIVDRTKDLIRSGGEWISSVELENALMDHPAVSEAAVVAVPHPRWQERPLACVVLRPEAKAVDDEALLGVLEGRVPGWWVPDRVVRRDSIPRTGTGKFDKKALRDLYGGDGEEA